VLVSNKIAQSYFDLCGEPVGVGYKFQGLQSPQIMRLVSSIKQAHEGFKSMVLLCKNEHEVSIAVTPFSLNASISPTSVASFEKTEFDKVQWPLSTQRLALLTTQRPQLCDVFSVRSYGQLLGLTDSELKVLLQLVDGQDPSNAAANLTLSVTTIRSHIKSILSKSDATCIRNLLLRIAKLPPLKSGLIGNRSS
jgi:DNA-binding NarL/FixJ family response regulator